LAFPSGRASVHRSAAACAEQLFRGRISNPHRFQGKGNIMVRKLVSIGLVAGALVTAACNTVHGVGKDVSSAGNAVSNAADKSH
jgi:predicted small secreted protein